MYIDISRITVCDAARAIDDNKIWGISRLNNHGSLQREP